MKLVLVLLGLVGVSQAVPQKPNLDAILNRRTDVYIAGFFPFGKGVENANTGNLATLVIILRMIKTLVYILWLQFSFSIHSVASLTLFIKEGKKINM